MSGLLSPRTFRVFIRQTTGPAAKSTLAIATNLRFMVLPSYREFFEIGGVNRSAGNTHSGAMRKMERIILYFSGCAVGGIPRLLGRVGPGARRAAVRRFANRRRGTVQT